MKKNNQLIYKAKQCKRNYRNKSIDKCFSENVACVRLWRVGKLARQKSEWHHSLPERVSLSLLQGTGHEYKLWRCLTITDYIMTTAKEQEMRHCRQLWTTSQRAKGQRDRDSAYKIGFWNEDSRLPALDTAVEWGISQKGRRAQENYARKDSGDRWGDSERLKRINMRTGRNSAASHATYNTGLSQSACQHQKDKRTLEDTWGSVQDE